ncbi:potassium/proton antiporter [Anaerobium acetethylicum]|uniref:Cell volume regulation protein A n=1 Tax=Anaerobium acetethylicum TaxID=1619234 RepID=A0A1D3TSV2_9FIRM|nr:potassium/proton antiporter [Anaerobium acetethylicum]SCP96896.1 cell volume regulation protein A [Anaerobium acetethylicum]
MSIYLFITAVIIIICILFNKISSKIGIPTLFAFILLGMLFGSDGLVKIPFDDFRAAEQICSIALIFIMFYGGFGTNWNEARPVAVKSILLSTIGVAATAGLTGLFCHFVLHIGFLESLLIGSVISSTDAASVFSILRSKRMNLKYNTASMLEIESGSNDPGSYMMTVIVLSVMNGQASAGPILYTVFAQLVYGAVIGVGIAAAAVFILRRFQFATEGFDAVFVFAIAVLAYAVPGLIGGNGYLSAYIVGIILGNSNIKNKQAFIHFFDGVTGIMQMLIFFLLGLLAFPSQLPSVLKTAIAIFLFLTFVARPASIFLILFPAKSRMKHMLFMSFAGLRGAASIVFAIMTVVDPASTNHDIFHIVFFIVLLSIAFQGTLLPFMASKLDMIDENTDVLKTFNDYSEETQVQFIRLEIGEKHQWKGRKLKEIVFPPDTLLAMIIRNNETLVPNGSSVLQENDVAILSALSFDQKTEVHLVELPIRTGNRWIGKMISEFSPNPGQIVIMIKRGEQIIIPKGPTRIQAGDVLVMNKFGT